MVDNIKQKTVVHFIADGEVKEFNFNFQIFEAGDVDVYLDETLTDTGYNVSIDEEIGGKVIFNQPPVNGTRITVIRNLDIKRTSDFQEGGAFRAKVINHELDYQVATLQQLDEKIGRSMIYPPYVQDGVSMQLPLPSAGKALVWNQQATALTNSSINVDNTIAEVTALQQQTEKAAEQVAEHRYEVLQQSAETVKNAQKAQEAAEKALTYAESASFGNIGDIKYTTRTDIPNGGVWCDGTEYTQAMFPDVYQMLIDGKISSTDYSTFDSTVSANGSCGLFALDIEATSFKVPLLKDIYLKAGQSPLMFGAESLPNITGYTEGSQSGNAIFNNTSGALFGTKQTTWNVGNQGTTQGSYIKRLQLDASRSSSTYQNGAKVNTDHVVYRAYVVLYSSVAEISIADYTGVIEEKTQEGLDALSSASNALTQKDITNCVTKIPQDIKLELVDGTLTLKAGSKVYVPKGAGVFDEVVIDVDKTFSPKNNSQDLLFIKANGGASWYDVSLCFSGEIQPTFSGSNAMWYDTGNNTIKETNNGGSSWTEGVSFPVAQVTDNGTIATSINQVFNGFGYIGSTVFVLPNVEGLIPNGRNADGSLKNLKFKTTEVQTWNAYTGDLNLRNFTISWNESLSKFDLSVFGVINDNMVSRYYVQKEEPELSNTQLWYNPETAIWKARKFDDWETCFPLIIFSSTVEDNHITSFSPKNVFQAVDRNDSEWASTAGKPSNRYVDIQVQSSNATYTAPANGYVYVAQNNSSTGFMNIYLADSGGLGSMTYVGSNQTNKTNISVKSGDKFIYAYSGRNDSSPNNTFRFIYDEGAK